MLLTALFLLITASTYLKLSSQRKTMPLRGTSRSVPTKAIRAEKSVIDVQLNDTQIHSVESFLVSFAHKFGASIDASTTSGENGEVLRRILNLADGSKISYSLVGAYVSDHLDEVIKNIENIHIDARKKVVHDSDEIELDVLTGDLFEHPFEKIKSTGPLEFVRDHSGSVHDQTSKIHSDIIGEVFFGLLRNQMRLDTTTAVLGGDDKTFYRYSSAGADENIGEIELRLADLVIGHSLRTRNKHIYTVQNEKRVVAKYIKDRVIPFWFSSDHREDLCDLLGVSNCAVYK